MAAASGLSGKGRLTSVDPRNCPARCFTVGIAQPSYARGPPVAAMQRSDIFCAPPRSGANLGFMVATKQNGETIVADHSVEWRAQLSGQDVRTRVFSLIAEHLHVDPTLLRDEALFVNELGADWLDRLELITAVERDFAIELPDQAIDDSVIVGDLIRIVERAVSGKSAI